MTQMITIITVPQKKLHPQNFILSKNFAEQEKYEKA